MGLLICMCIYIYIDRFDEVHGRYGEVMRLLICMCIYIYIDRFDEVHGRYGDVMRLLICMCIYIYILIVLMRFMVDMVK